MRSQHGGVSEATQVRQCVLGNPQEINRCWCRSQKSVCRGSAEHPGWFQLAGTERPAFGHGLRFAMQNAGEAHRSIADGLSLVARWVDYRRAAFFLTLRHALSTDACISSSFTPKS